MNHSLWSLALLLVPSLLFAQNNFDKVVIKTSEVAGNVHMLEGSGGNIALSTGPDGVLMVDSQFAPLAPKIADAIEKLGHGQPKFLINTHLHGDHSGGNASFGTNAHIVAHSNARIRLAGQPNTPAVALPKITYANSTSIHFNGEEIKLIHSGPGHTDGDTIVHFTKSGVVHMGDLFFHGRFPFIDLSSGGSIEGEINNIAQALQWIPKDAKIIPGHGPLATYQDLEKFHAMLVETTSIVKKAIAEGKTAEEVRTAGLPEKWKDWGTGFINTRRWLEITYNSLKGSK